MNIFNKNNQLILDVQVDDSSYRTKEIMGQNNLSLFYSLPYYYEIPAESWCMYKNEKYFLLKPMQWKEINTRNFEYTLVMDSYQAWLGKILVRSMTDVPKRVKFSLTAQPYLHLKLIIDSLNARDSGWAIGEYITAEDLTIDYNSESCLSALQKVAEAFKTEWEVVNKTINLKKVEKEIDSPIRLGYGMGRGFVSGVGRANRDSQTAITRLYVQGGSRNIDRSKYNGSDVLTMKKNQRMIIRGKVFQTDLEGLYVDYLTFDNQLRDTISEGSIDLSNIYPKRVGTVSSVVVVNNDKCLYDIKDTSIPSTLNYNDYLIPNEKFTIVFQTGLLSGREFEVSKYNHEEKRFELVPVDNLPKAPIIPAVGDKYAVFNVMLPDSYIASAENDMMMEAMNYLYENSDQRFTFTGELDKIYTRKNWLEIGGKLDCGYYVRFMGDNITDQTLVRIVSVRDYVNNPLKPTITLSNVTQKNNYTNAMAKVNTTEVLADRKDRVVMDYAKRTWQDVMSLQQSLYDPDGTFQDGIYPLYLQTMQIVAGTQSLQFQFLAEDWLSVIQPSFLFDKASAQFKAPVSRMQHMTLGIDNVKPQSARTQAEYKYWLINSYISPNNLDEAKGYYFYAKCSKTGTVQNGRWTGSADYLLSETPIELEQVPGFYHFWVGFLSSVFENDRSFRTMYGYTEILPGQITADNFISSDGKSYLKFLANQFKFGGGTSGIDWNVTKANQLTILGAIMQSQSGESAPLGVFRGVYDAGKLYYEGDEVIDNGSYYQCIKNNQNRHPKDNTDYWELKSVGTVAAVWCGEWNKNPAGQPVKTLYIGNTQRRDVVKYNGVYYIAKIGQGGFEDNTWNPARWDNFGAQFSSIATGTLLAENANLANFIFKNQILQSQSETNGVPNIKLDGNTGFASFAGGNAVFNADGSVDIKGKFTSEVGLRKVEVNAGNTGIEYSYNGVPKVQIGQATGDINSGFTGVYGNGYSAITTPSAVTITSSNGVVLLSPVATQLNCPVSIQKSLKLTGLASGSGTKRYLVIDENGNVSTGSTAD